MGVGENGNEKMVPAAGGMMPPALLTGGNNPPYTHKSLYGVQGSVAVL